MGAKILVIVAAVIVVAAGAGGAYFLLKDKDKDPDSDYTLLDSNDNIKAGMTVKMNMESEGYTVKETCVVKEVKDGKVTYSDEMNADQSTFSPSMMDLSDFLPDAIIAVPFDYKDGPVPAGITVTPADGEYTISGTMSGEYFGSKISYTFESLKIKTNAITVTSVDGTIKYSTESSDGKMNTDTTYRTTNGVLESKYTEDESYTYTCDVGKFYSKTVGAYDPSEYAGATVTESAGSVGNVDVTVYTINGTSIGGDTYKDAKLSVYKGYTIKGEGSMNGRSATMNVSIYIA